jgi:hypothetical protein
MRDIRQAIAQAAQLRAEHRWAEAADVEAYIDSALVRLDAEN